MTHFPLIILQLLELSVLLKVDIRPQKPEHYRVQLMILCNALSTQTWKHSHLTS